ncbi:Sulfatase [hydrothermal vent metagenome]|uniref:Sulfatase n=1 Tax=hydrothermal vent metagenome TaxID=652676 RepID=A0A3B1DM31_9ZZZZ
MRHRNNILIIVLLILTSYSSLAMSKEKRSKEKPNVLFIFADDQTFDTLNSLGNKEIETPHLDRLVRNGTTFTHAYNMGSWTGAVCVASRHMLNTGRYLWHARTASQQCSQEVKAGRFWSEHMKKAGYETYMSGKWHVRAKANSTFQNVVHVRPGMPNQTSKGYNRPLDGKPDTWKPWDKKNKGYWKGGKHWSEVLGDDAETFLAKASQSEKPFFMYLAFNAPHDPRQSPKKYVDKYPLKNIAMPKNFLPEYPYNEAMGSGRTLRDERLAPFPRTPHSVKVNRQEYYAIITHMDVQIGRILDALEKSGKAKNTYIFFTADHGLAVGRHGLMGKQNMFDHSVRVPFIVNGPDIGKNKKIDGAIYLQDIMPTTLELAGVAKPKHVQFKSILPLLKGERTQNYTSLYGAYTNVQRSVTVGDYKLILYPKIKKVLLFNLKNDSLEMHNLAEKTGSQPIIKHLMKELRKLQKETGDQLDLSKDFPKL